MAETHATSLNQEGALPERTAGTVSVALVNAMSDAALAVTERRFTRLLQSALPGHAIDLRLATLPEIPRGEMAAARIARFYTPLADLIHAPPDAVIFSGAEPATDDLRDEVFWPSLHSLFGWVQRGAIPSLFSCLAAHAAVLHFSGIRRRRLPRKAFGLFAQSPAMAHPLLRGVKPLLHVAHSRWNDVSAADLAAGGYCVLTSGPQTEADMFVPRSGAPFLFLQGHPEYEASALEAEYRRDMRRFAAGESGIPPERPVNVPGAPAPPGIAGFAEQGAPVTVPANSGAADAVLRNWISASKEMAR